MENYNFCLRLQPGFPPFGPTILWAPCMCWLRPCLEANAFSHLEHLYGFSPVCCLSCATRVCSVLSFFGQYLHWNLGSSCVLSWVLRWARFPLRKGQCLHWYFLSVVCSALWCCMHRNLELNVMEHDGQGNLTFSWTLNLCIFKLLGWLNLWPHLSQ